MSMLISEKARFFEFFHAAKAIPPQGMPISPQALKIFRSHALKNKKVRPKNRADTEVQTVGADMIRLS